MSKILIRIINLCVISFCIVSSGLQSARLAWEERDGLVTDDTNHANLKDILITAIEEIKKGKELNVKGKWNRKSDNYSNILWWRLSESTKRCQILVRFNDYGILWNRNTWCLSIDGNALGIENELLK